jgi:hypothetical protein
MSNKKDRPEVLRDGASIVGGPDKRKVIETPSTTFHDKPSIPGHDPAAHAHLTGPGKKRFPLKGKSGW